MLDYVSDTITREQFSKIRSKSDSWSSENMERHALEIWIITAMMYVQKILHNTAGSKG